MKNIIYCTLLLMSCRKTPNMKMSYDEYRMILDIKEKEIRKELTDSLKTIYVDMVDTIYIDTCLIKIYD